jgi:hypothetical protein
MIHPFGFISSIVELTGRHIHHEREYSPTPRGKRLVVKLRREIKKLPKITTKKSLALSTWDQNRSKLREHILSNNPFAFLRWPVVQWTMVADCSIVEFVFLLLHGFGQWKPFLAESNMGMGKKYTFYPQSSPNLLHTAYNLRQLLRFPVWTKELESVVEFGGGYGCMCSLIYKSGFKGKYAIFDLPEFSALQKFYLTSILSASKAKNLTLYSGPTPEKFRPTLLIGTWSLSETDLATRTNFFKKMDPEIYFIAYQDMFGEMNNVSYFRKFRKERPAYQWFDYPILHLPGNRYMVGVKKNSRLSIAKKVIEYVSSRRK